MSCNPTPIKPEGPVIMNTWEKQDGRKRQVTIYANRFWQYGPWMPDPEAGHYSYNYENPNSGDHSKSH